MAMNTVPPETVAAILKNCRDGLTMQEIADKLQITRNQATGVVAKNGGAEKVRGYLVQRGRAPGVPQGTTTRKCYIQGCGGDVVNTPSTAFRMCEAHRRHATERFSGLGNIGTESGKRNGSTFDEGHGQANGSTLDEGHRQANG